MQPDLRCYYHPRREATSQCDRCGDYLCDECVSAGRKKHLCEKCRRVLGLESLGRYYTEAAARNAIACVMAIMVLPGIVFFALAIAGLNSARRRDKLPLGKMGASIAIFSIGGISQTLVVGLFWALGIWDMASSAWLGRLPAKFILVPMGILSIVAALMCVLSLVFWSMSMVEEKWPRSLRMLTLWPMLFLALFSGLPLVVAWQAMN